MVNKELEALNKAKSPRDIATREINELAEEDIRIDIPPLAKEFSDTQSMLFKGSTLKKTLARIYIMKNGQKKEIKKTSQREIKTKDTKTIQFIN